MDNEYQELIDSYVLYESTGDLDACRERHPIVFADLIALIQLEQILCDLPIPAPTAAARTAARAQLLAEARAAANGPF